MAAQRRIIVAVLDGVGAGELPDAAHYGDAGSNTLAHTAQSVGGLNLPHMGAMGLGCITKILGVSPTPNPTAHWGKMTEASPGKDTITGHWEMAGIVLPHPFPTYPNGFPADVIAAFEQRDWNPNAGQFRGVRHGHYRAVGRGTSRARAFR